MSEHFCAPRVILGGSKPIPTESPAMARFDRCAALLLLFVAPVPLVTQSRQPVPIEPLLRSEEPRLIALGAWEVIRRQDDSLNPLLIELAER